MESREKEGIELNDDDDDWEKSANHDCERSHSSEPRKKVRRKGPPGKRGLCADDFGAEVIGLSEVSEPFAPPSDVPGRESSLRSVFASFGTILFFPIDDPESEVFRRSDPASFRDSFPA